MANHECDSVTKQRAWYSYGTSIRYRCFYCLMFFVVVVYPCHLVCSPLPLALLPISIRNSDPGSHGMIGSPPPCPLQFVPWKAFLSREHFSPFFPRRLVYNTLIELTHAAPSQQLVSSIFLKVKNLLSPRWDLTHGINSINISIRRYL